MCLRAGQSGNGVTGPPSVYSRGRAEIRSQNPSARPGFRPAVAEKNKTLNSVISRLLSWKTATSYWFLSPISWLSSFSLYSTNLSQDPRKNEVKSSELGRIPPFLTPSKHFIPFSATYFRPTFCAKPATHFIPFSATYFRPTLRANKAGLGVFCVGWELNLELLWCDDSIPNHD